MQPRSTSDAPFATRLATSSRLYRCSRTCMP
jgi:hypothetical protein